MPCTDVWFEPTPGGSLLMIACSSDVVRQAPDRIVAEFAGSYLLLERKTVIRGQTVFEAKSIGWEDGSLLAEQDQIWRLEGPWRGGLQVAS